MSEQPDRNEPIILCEDVHKWFGSFEALRGISMEVNKGEVIVIFGPSGSGKSTFIRTLNRLEVHQKGKIIIDGIELTKDVHNIEAVRMETGMVFQQFNLFPHLCVLDNITLAPMKVRKWSKDKAEEIGRQLLQRVGIPEQAEKYPNQLSGGQQQRVAIARALVSKPKVLLADEPTGNLDSARSREIMKLLSTLNKDTGITIIMVTHEQEAAEYAGRIIHFLDGRIESDMPNGGNS